MSNEHRHDINSVTAQGCIMVGVYNAIRERSQ